MGAVEETRKAIQDFLAPEIRTLTARMEVLVKEQAQLRSELRSDIKDTEGRLRSEVVASEARVTAAIERLRSDMPLLIRNAVLEQLLAEKQRVIDDFQKQAH